MDNAYHLSTILIYEEVYGYDTPKPSVEDLIHPFPSISLLRLISLINLQIFSNENPSRRYKIQKSILDDFFCSMPVPSQELIVNAINRLLRNGFDIFIFHRETNLRMYHAIFLNWNEFQERKLVDSDANATLNAYLIANSEAAIAAKLTEEKLNKMQETGKSFEDIILGDFIYQHDLKSTSDFWNQVTRAYFFMDYLQKSDEFNVYFRNYLALLNLQNKEDFISTIILVVCYSLTSRLQNMEMGNALKLSHEPGKINLEYLKSITINAHIADYEIDDSFSLLRNYPLYQHSSDEFLILDINFLIDKLYKNFIFHFRTFLEANQYKGNFNSIKGKEFMQDIYFYKLIPRCFNTNHYKLLSGKDTEDKLGNELCDYYIQQRNKIALLELKDVTLNSKVKNEGDVDKLIDAMNLKMWKNEKNKAKGGLQLVNAILELDKLINLTEPTDIYPIIVYTDDSFGFESVNKRNTTLFNEALSKTTFNPNYLIKPLIYLNLNSFEYLEDMLFQEKLDFFDILNEYSNAILDPYLSPIPIERFIKNKMNEKGLRYSTSSLTDECIEAVTGIKITKPLS